MLMEEKAKRVRAKENKALGKEKEKVTQRAKAKILFSLERANRQTAKGNQCSGLQTKTLGTKAGTKVNSLERVMEKVAKPLPKERAKLRVSIVVLQGILLETAR